LQRTINVKYFTNTSLNMLIKHAILAVLSMPSIMATLLGKLKHEEMATTLIAEKEEDLVKTFKKFEKEQDKYELSQALVDVAKAPEHMPKVVTCLRTVDPFPKEMSNLGEFVQNTLFYISYDTSDDTESFIKAIITFEPSDVKPLASIRHLTFRRNDAVKVVESIMAKSPKLITGSLSRWLADHSFDQNSEAYTYDKVACEKAFQYLTFFATERVLTDALAIVKANEHFKVDSHVCCCYPQDSFPHDLVTKLERLLAFVKGRNAHINETLTFLPKVLAEMVANYLPPSTETIA